MSVLHREKEKYNKKNPPFLARNPLQATHYRRGYKRPLASKFHVIILSKTKNSRSQKTIILITHLPRRRLKRGLSSDNPFFRRELCLCLIEKTAFSSVGLARWKAATSCLGSRHAVHWQFGRRSGRPTHFSCSGRGHFLKWKGVQGCESGRGVFSSLSLSLCDLGEMRWMFILGVFLKVFLGMVNE